jgi:hypothetical protein
MTIHRKIDIAYYTFPVLDDLGIAHGIFMRHGGVSHAPWSSLNLATTVGDTRENVIENRRRITACLNRAAESIYDVWQVHSNTVISTVRPRHLDTPHLKADAIITDNFAVTLMMLFADCVPILLYDRKTNTAAIAHAGWQGTVNKVVESTITKMIVQHGCAPETITACIGPSICVDHYQVGENVVEAVSRVFTHNDEILFEKDGHYYFNLQNANRQIIAGQGIADIHISGICTAENTADWFSHRAEAGKTGRFAAILTVKGGQ